jgi:hypothetical protein
VDGVGVEVVDGVGVEVVDGVGDADEVDVAVVLSLRVQAASPNVTHRP